MYSQKSYTNEPRPAYIHLQLTQVLTSVTNFKIRSRSAYGSTLTVLKTNTSVNLRAAVKSSAREAVEGGHSKRRQKEEMRQVIKGRREGAGDLQDEKEVTDV